MTSKKKVKEIKGVFLVENKNSFNPKWSIDDEKLKELLKNQECYHDVKERFYDMFDNTKFNAQVIELSGVNNIGDPYKRFVISLGHFMYAHHYTYFPDNENWYQTSINQDFFNDIVNPFQERLNTKPGDFLFSKNDE